MTNGATLTRRVYSVVARMATTEMAAASQTLSRLAAGLSSFRGFEKNLLAKKFFESIIYSKESIELSVSLSSGQKKENRPLGAANSVCKEYMAPRVGIEPTT